MALAARQETSTSIRVKCEQIGRECLDECAQDRDLAWQLMRRKIREDPALREEIIEPSIDQLCMLGIRDADATQRVAIMRGEGRIAAVPNPDQGVTALERMADAYLDFPLVGGMLLRYATQDDIDRNIRFWASHERTARINRRWLELVREALGPGSTVEAAMSNAVLSRLRKQAEQE